MLMLRITDENQGRIKLQLKTPSNSGIQLQTHPNIDKDLLKNRGQIALKNPAKPFPTNTDVGVLKWRFTTTDESFIPLSSESWTPFPLYGLNLSHLVLRVSYVLVSVNCWPSENGQGGCDVNIEYELEQENLELKDVVITIPIP